MIKEYVVMSSGHGSPYRFAYQDGDFNVCPPPADRWITKEQAEADCEQWRGSADTIGGQAVVVHVPTYLKTNQGVSADKLGWSYDGVTCLA